jgi:hypothetical protein
VLFRHLTGSSATDAGMTSSLCACRAHSTPQRRRCPRCWKGSGAASSTQVGIFRNSLRPRPAAAIQTSGQGGVCLALVNTRAMCTAGSMHSLVASPYKSAYNAAKHGVSCCHGAHCRHCFVLRMHIVLRMHSMSRAHINGSVHSNNEAVVLQALLGSRRQWHWRRPRALASPATPSAPATCSQRWSRTSWRTPLASAASARCRTAVPICSTAHKGRTGAYIHCMCCRNIC